MRQFLLTTVFCALSAPAFASPIMLNGMADGSAVIDENNTVVSTISVTDPILIADVNVIVDAPHTFAADLIVELTGPDLTTIRLMGDGPGGFGLEDGGTRDGLSMTIFDDEASDLIAAVSIPANDIDAPITGSFIPREALSIFDGISAVGDWVLTIADDGIGDSGRFEGWTLVIEPVDVPEPATLALFGLGLAAAAGARRRSR